MKKRLLVLAVIGLVLVMVGTDLLMAAASRFGKYYGPSQRDTLTVDAQWTATAWDSGGAVIATGLDSANFALCVTFNVDLAPFEKLYVGFDDDTTAGAVTVPDMCTLLVQPDVSARNPTQMSFVLRDTDRSPNGTTAQTDTFFVLFATGASTSKVKVTDLVFDVIATDSAF